MVAATRPHLKYHFNDLIHAVDEFHQFVWRGFRFFIKMAYFYNFLHVDITL